MGTNGNKKYIHLKAQMYVVIIGLLIHLQSLFVNIQGNTCDIALVFRVKGAYKLNFRGGNAEIHQTMLF